MVTPPDVESEPRASRSARWLVTGWSMVAALVVLTTVVHYRSVANPVLVAASVCLPWLWCAGIVGVSLLTLWSRQRRLWLPVGVLVLGLASIWGRVWVGYGSDRSGRSVRVLTWNVQRLGWEDSDGGGRLSCVVERVRSASPDAIALLEVSERDTARLSQRLGMDCTHTDYEGSGDPGHGGLAVCAMGAEWALARTSPVRFTPDHDWHFVFGEFTEVGRADVQIPSESSGVFNLLAVHLRPYGRLDRAQITAVSEAQRASTDALLARMTRLRDPTIVAGDFNSVRDAPVHVAMRSYLVDAFEQAGWGLGPTVWAGGWLPLRVDYIYASPAFGIAAAWQPDWECSDHRPVLAEVVL